MSRFVRGSVSSCIFAGCFCSLGCGSLPVSRVRMDQLRTSIERVSHAGALICAPRELALARSHYDFAQTELLHGDATRALRHLSLAEQNVGAAQLLTPDRGCKSARSSTQEVSAIANGSSRSSADRRPAQAFRTEADGGGHPALPSGAVKGLSGRVASTARDLTLTAYEPTGCVSALNASQVTYAASDRYSTAASDQSMTNAVKQTSLTPRIYGERRLDE